MKFFKLPTKPGSILIGYFSSMFLGLAVALLGLSMHTEASMVSGALLGAYVGLYFPQVWSHVTAYRHQVYRSEWRFMAITLTPIPVWIGTMFFAHVSDNHAALLVLPAATFLLAYLLPSNEQTSERIPVWQT